ncbi:MAG TPA: sugar transferase [Nocardioidaceae bacterium]|nr:sugar transferase [Nocardioidaceae bacterium]
MLILAVLLADAGMLVAAALLGWNLRFTVDMWAQHPAAGVSLAASAAPWIVVAWLLILGAQGAYAVRNFGAGAEEFRKVMLASMLTGGLVGMSCYLMKMDLSRGFVLLTFFIGTPLLLVERYGARKVLHALRGHDRLAHRVVVVGGPAGITEVVEALQRESFLGFRVVGACVPPQQALDPSSRTPVPVLGTVDRFRQICETVGADTVLVARGGYADSRELRRIAWDLEGSSIDLVVVPSLTDVAGPRIHMRPVAGLPLLHVEQPTAGAAGGLGKRVFDVVTASLALIVLSPLMLAIAVAIKLHDGGPVLFRQPRVGRSGERFGMWKFRSMVLDAECHEAQMRQDQGHEGALWKMRDDPRITSLGRFIRRNSIDELPQLFNVLRGEMSVVGPRPQQAWEVDTYEVDVRRRLLVRPGLTGLWQVSGRSSLSWSDAVRLDLYYVDNWSMTSDLVIIAKTVRAVVCSSGAY